MKGLIVLALLSLLSIALCEVESDKSHGWGDKIQWKKLDEALSDDSKPTLVVIHKSWCGACKNLRPKFAESEEIAQLSAHFNMVNTLDDEEPSDSQFKPDGGYIPRILFVDHKTKKVDPNIYNENGNPSYKYYYGDVSGIADAMKRAKELLKA
ncbi:thioredoxin domain containing like [Planoprotostelium fungivorum]|uniref:Thioredoxin domain containing like n=1 Tax=Planoprotostelium fungivorum TaxID=1890364 RepID=A0A2P6NWE4_9EUKA|nr:thioredoxin domain containing like [Planoprotostelium fungivorum]